MVKGKIVLEDSQEGQMPKKKKPNKDYLETDKFIVSKDKDGSYKAIFKESAKIRKAPENDYDRADLFNEAMNGLDEIRKRLRAKKKPPSGGGLGDDVF